MPKTHAANAPRFETLLEERLYLLWCATLYGGKLPVDLKRHPPSNRGIVPQMIAQGLFEPKRGSTLTLTEKGRLYMKRHGNAAHKPDTPIDISGLSQSERDLRIVLGILLLPEAGSVDPERLGEEWKSAVDRGYFELVPHQYGPRHFRFRPMGATRSLVTGMGDKGIRSMIDCCEDPTLRSSYAAYGLSGIIALIDAHVEWPSGSNPTA